MNEHHEKVKEIIKKIWVFFLGIFLMFFSWSAQTIQAQSSTVPTEYFPNYQVAGQWLSMISIFEQIQAAVKVWSKLENTKFRELQTIFSTIFKFFPQTPSWRVVYEQCQLSITPLTSWFDQGKYTVYKDKCFVPLNEIMRAIVSQYTVKARIVASPNKWSAPLNVTFDARWSVDAPFSNDTLPDSNFYWYYRDIDWRQVQIGRGAVVNHTFQRPWNYIVHLTARSANNLTKGIFDGESSIAVNVWPRSANVAVYVAWNLWNPDAILRLGTQEAQRGVLVDWSATTPLWWRTITSYVWTVIDENDARFQVRRSWSWNPDQFVQSFPRNWLYKLTLQVTDNENNTVIGTYRISVSDPVAKIKMTPDQWTSTTTFTFDANGSFSLTSRIARYQWTVTDKDWKQIDTFDTKQFKRRFSIPGEYAIKLTVTDEIWVSSIDVMQIFVDSTPPIPSFTFRPMSDLLYPSQFIVDANGSFDEDERNGVDNLTYERIFSPRENVGAETYLEWGKIGIITFDQPWKYKVQLNVTDSFQKSASIEREITVVSTLRPELLIEPSNAVLWWERVTLTVKANKQVSYVERNMWDGKIQRTTDMTASHTYEAAGSYKVTAQVVTPSWESNTITRLVFVWQKERPIVAHEVRLANSEYILPDETVLCGPWEPAYVLDRYQKVTLDASKSRSVRWAKNDPLNIIVQQQNANQQRTNRMQLEFDEKGCQFVDIFVEDPLVIQTDTKKIWFAVQNALPTMDNVTISFPQYGDQTVGGFTPTTAAPRPTWTQDIFATTFLDPVTVRVQVANPRDSDWFLTKFVWYYIKSEDPENLIEVKYTPPGVNHTIFSVPRQSWTQFEFGVRVVDSDGGETDSRDFFGWKWPIVAFPPDNNNPDIPIATLLASQTNIQVWDIITFTANASILSRKADFEATRYFKYDFNWDGIYDLTTNKAVVQYTYTEPSPEGSAFRPRVKVFYRNRAGTAFSTPIIVRQRLQPQLYLQSVWTKTLLVPQVFGEVEKSELCLDIKQCTTNKDYFKPWNEAFIFDYQEPWTYTTRFFVMDKFGNQKTQRDDHTVQSLPGLWSGETRIAIMSYPQARLVEWTYQIAVWNALKNTIKLYIHHEWEGNCFIDKNVLEDSNNDGDPIRDNDGDCNTLHTFTYLANEPFITPRIYFARDGRPTTQDLRVEFIDYQEVVSVWDQRLIKEIDMLIADARNLPQDQLTEFYLTLLLDLKSRIDETDARSGIILQLYDLIFTHPNLLPQQQKQQLERFLSSMSDGSITASLWWNEYEKAKMDILLRFKDNAKTQVETIFDTFERFDGTWWPEARKKLLDTILNIAVQERDNGNLDEVDIVVITRSLCEIIVFYDLPSVSCGTIIAIQGTGEVVEITIGEGKNVLSKILKRVLWIGWILLIWFIALIFLFAIKAKMQKKEQEENNDTI
jgi:PKD repeat protein